MLPQINTKEPHVLVEELKDLLVEAGEDILIMNAYTDLPDDENHILNRILRKVEFVDEWLTG